MYRKTVSVTQTGIPRERDEITGAAVGELARVNGLALQELSEHQASLEDRYMELTSDSVDYRTTGGALAMHAAPGRLTLRAAADSAENLRHIQDLVTARLEKVGRRDHLTVTWQPSEASAVRPGE